MPYSQPDPAEEPTPLWISDYATYLLSLRNEDRAAARGRVPVQYHAALDECMRLQAIKGEETRNSSVRERTRVELEVREARRNADAIESQNDRQPVRCSLTEELALEDEDEEYAIDKLLPIDGNALFAGRYKAGKTTFNANLLKAWADDERFLGHYKCTPDPERPVVTIFNYEMSRRQFRRWMRRFNITNTDRIHPVHLRGVSLPIALPQVRKKIVGWLRDNNTGLWIIDPASRAMTGSGDPEKNADVSVFTSWIDEIKTEAGVRDLVMNIHMPHNAKENNAERAIGAQAWSAWADSLWMLTLDDDNCRWFHAYGRDVDEEKQLVNYDKQSMAVDLINTDPETIKQDRLERSIITVIDQNPGITKRGIRDQVTAFTPVRVIDIDHTIQRLIKDGTVITRPGPRNSILHDLASGVLDLDSI